MRDEYRPWHWRNCRELTLSCSVLLFPWQWRLKWDRVSEYDEWHALAVMGPLVLKLYASYGNLSTGDWRARFALSDNQAWERSK